MQPRRCPALSHPTARCWAMPWATPPFDLAAWEPTPDENTAKAVGMLATQGGPSTDAIYLLLRPCAQVLPSEHIVQALELLQVAESPPHPCLEQFRTGTIEAVGSRISVAIELLKAIAPEHFSKDPEAQQKAKRSLTEAIQHAIRFYQQHANLSTLEHRQELFERGFNMPVYLRDAAEDHWHEWSAGWRLFWRSEVEPALEITTQGIDHWISGLKALICIDSPHIVVQIVLRRTYGTWMEEEAWWENRAGFDKAVLDSVEPLDDDLATALLIAEWVRLGL